MADPAALYRDFLLTRLPNDKDKPGTSEDDRNSDSSSETEAKPMFDLSHPGLMPYLAMAQGMGGMPFFNPFLYQQLLHFPMDKLRLALQSPGLGSPVVAASPLQGPTTPESSASAGSPSPRKRPASVKKGKDCSPVKKARATKKLNFDEETQSPVSGMFIKDAEEIPSTGELQAKADLDESAKFVVISDEAKAELAKIPNDIGDYVCRLCRVRYDDCFTLAQHRCPRIVHQEYRCSECDKVFSCPANLASHKRWHKPRGEMNNNARPLNLSLSMPPSYQMATNNNNPLLLA